MRHTVVVAVVVVSLLALTACGTSTEKVEAKAEKVHGAASAFHKGKKVDAAATATAAVKNDDISNDDANRLTTNVLNFFWEGMYSGSTWTEDQQDAAVCILGRAMDAEKAFRLIPEPPMSPLGSFKAVKKYLKKWAKRAWTSMNNDGKFSWVVKSGVSYQMSTAARLCFNNQMAEARDCSVLTDNCKILRCYKSGGWYYWNPPGTDCKKTNRIFTCGNDGECASDPKNPCTGSHHCMCDTDGSNTCRCLALLSNDANKACKKITDL